MARREDDREDLLAEATALVPRMEWQWPEGGEVVTAGLRRNGSVSIYFGGEPVYQFDPAGGLRRAFVDGRLYRTQGTTLARLTRIRTDRETQLLRCDLSADELDQFLTEMQQRLWQFLTAVASGKAAMARCVPVAARTETLLTAIQRAAAARQLAPRCSTRA